jgi:hypothetical protein
MDWASLMRCPELVEGLRALFWTAKLLLLHEEALRAYLAEMLAPEFREIADRRMKEINAAYEELKRRFK